MAQTPIDRLVGIGHPPEQAKILFEVVNGIVSGGMSPAAAQSDSTATTIAGLVADFNALLAKLRTAGILES